MTTATQPVINIKAQVLRVIERHEGQGNAILSLDLASAMGLPRTHASQRKLQMIIRELRRENKPVLSTCSPPYGYYWPGSWAEGQECLASIRSRLIEDALTRRDIKLGLGLHFEGAKKVKLL